MSIGDAMLPWIVGSRIIVQPELGWVSKSIYMWFGFSNIRLWGKAYKATEYRQMKLCARHPFIRSQRPSQCSILINEIRTCHISWAQKINEYVQYRQTNWNLSSFNGHNNDQHGCSILRNKIRACHLTWEGKDQPGCLISTNKIGTCHLSWATND